jgi:hypothetical protein
MVDCCEAEFIAGHSKRKGRRMISLFAVENSMVADHPRSAKTSHQFTHSGLLKRSSLAAAFCLLALTPGVALAADTPAAAIAYRPGDTVRVFVKFKEPIGLKSADLRFALDGALPDGQKVFLNYFDLTSPVKSPDGEYELTVKIGDHVASGTYQVAFMNATDAADLTRYYAAGRDLPIISVSIRNDNQVSFLDIKSIRVGEQEDAKR